MILVYGVVLGGLFGLLVHTFLQKKYAIGTIKGSWLVFLAVIPQVILFQIPGSLQDIPNQIVSIVLIASQSILLIFTILNSQKIPFWFLGLGLLMNLVVITSNGGLMPIFPESVNWLLPNKSDAWEVGQRLGFGKDIVLQEVDTIFPQLADRFHFHWRSLKVVYSLGDIFIAMGAFMYMSGFFKFEVFHRLNEVGNA
ncbi:MAG: hypothetical protein CVU39_05805 [Chloroflexi bacterium HGW-Chloroflexi-10]|nr:MAG: hypothetical protein CVU39_05805 [Chloroflexi bacterium HGW-Chloroflexi-10]